MKHHDEPVETLPEMWSRHYDRLPEEDRLPFISRLKGLMHEGNADARISFEQLLIRWAGEKPAKK